MLGYMQVTVEFMGGFSLEFSSAVLTKGKSGKTEVRTLDSRGKFVMCKYLDPATLKPADAKRKLSLLDEEGNLREYFIIPIKGAKRYLMIEAEKEEKERKVWNEKLGREEDPWT